MAESTLSLQYSDYLGEIGWFLGYGCKASTGYSTEELAEITSIIKRGLRRFYSGTIQEGGSIVSHDWSFMHPVTTITTTASDEDQDLPDDFGGIEGNFSYAASEGWQAIVERPEGFIRQKRMVGTVTGRPEYYAIRPVTYDATDGQRFEVMWWPTPDSAYVLSYPYRSFPSTIDDTNIYPLGGMDHAETILEIMLSVAEESMDDESSVHTMRADQLLKASIGFDRRRAPASLGYNYGNDPLSDRNAITRTTTVTYNGQQS